MLVHTVRCNGVLETEGHHIRGAILHGQDGVVYPTPCFRVGDLGRVKATDIPTDRRDPQLARVLSWGRGVGREGRRGRRGGYGGCHSGWRGRLRAAAMVVRIRSHC